MLGRGGDRGIEVESRLDQDGRSKRAQFPLGRWGLIGRRPGPIQGRASLSALGILNRGRSQARHRCAGFPGPGRVRARTPFMPTAFQARRGDGVLATPAADGRRRFRPT